MLPEQEGIKEGLGADQGCTNIGDRRAVPQVAIQGLYQHWGYKVCTFSGDVRAVSLVVIQKNSTTKGNIKQGVNSGVTSQPD